MQFICICSILNKKYMASNKIKDFESIIKSTGLKATKGRVAVLSLLYKEAHPMTVDEIFRKNKDIDYVTVHRILKNFVKKGVVYQTDFRDGKAYFEFQDENHHHHHLVCTNCGNKESVSVCIGDSMYTKVKKESKSFSVINSHMLEFFGLCKKCS